MTKNMKGTKLESCSVNPLTGFNRDGYCSNNFFDGGKHLVCAKMTKEFLDYTENLGNPLRSVVNEQDKWCICEDRYLQAFKANKAPPVYQKATYEDITSSVKNAIIKQSGGQYMKEKYTGNVAVTYKGKTRRLPKRYIADLKGSERKAQIKSIFTGQDRPKTSAKSRKSGWTQKFNKVYGEEIGKLPGGKNLKNISKVTGVDLRALKQVYKKGKGAFRNGGSRPNQTADSWAYARCYSYIMGGPTRQIDNEVTRKFNVKFRH